MKSTKDFRSHGNGRSDDELRRGTKLAPAKKSGKERYSIYDSDDEDDDMSYGTAKKESVFDYFDDEEEDTSR